MAYISRYKTKRTEAELGQVKTRATTTVDADLLTVFLSLIHHLVGFWNISGRTRYSCLEFGPPIFVSWAVRNLAQGTCYPRTFMLDTTPMLSDESVLEVHLDENMLQDKCSPIYPPDFNPPQKDALPPTCHPQPCPSRQSLTVAIPMAIITHPNYRNSFSSLLPFCSKHLISSTMS